MLDTMYSGKNMFEAASAGTRIYTDWLKNANKVAVKGFDLGMKSVKGELADADDSEDFIDLCRSASKEFIMDMAETFDRIPFAGATPFNETAKPHLEAMIDDGHPLPALMKNMLDFNLRIMAASSATMKQFFEMGKFTADRFASLLSDCQVMTFSAARKASAPADKTEKKSGKASHLKVS